MRTFSRPLVRALSLSTVPPAGGRGRSMPPAFGRRHRRRGWGGALACVAAVAAALSLGLIVAGAAAGNLDTTFNAGGTGANGSVGALAVQSDGKVIAGGGFTAYNEDEAAPAAPSATAGQVVISEFRLSGPSGGNDEYVELYNNTDSPLSIGGYHLFWVHSNGSGGMFSAIPAGTVIPARGHFLAVGLSYSLATSAAGNHTFGSNILNGGVGLFAVSNFDYTPSTRIDSVAFSDLNPSGSFYSAMAEGTPLPQTGDSTEEHAWMRRLHTGQAQDTNNNAADFMLVSTSAMSINGVQPTLGAPGPENTASPLNRTGQIATSAIAPCVALTASPNRVRDTTPSDPATSSLGTLDIRRRFTNNTDASVTRLRFRIVDITTAPAPSGQADFRAVTSTDVVISNPCTGTTQNVRGTTLEQPPMQPNGGGFNSTLAAGTITPASPLEPGESTDVRLLLGVQQTGSFRFFIIVEAQQ